MTDKEQTAAICREIQGITQAVKQHFPFLRHQNLLGFSIFVICIAAILFVAFAYTSGSLGSWVAILLIAFLTSFLHELEHDLIHQLYFKKQPFLHNLMLFGVWIFRPLTLNPWMRRHLHYHHHRNSGTLSDIEERGVTNGDRWGLLRLFIMPDLILSGLLRSRTMRREIAEAYRQGLFSKQEIQNLRRVSIFGFLPFGLPLHLIWYSFLLFYAFTGTMALFSVSFVAPQWLLQYINTITPLVVLLIAPNMLRQFCLHFITSNLHYYGDVERGNIVQQTQVLNAWWTLPFQIFCFNFGSTHAIHHFVVHETFYIRQLTAASSHKVLLRYGVRFNDMGTFERANRYHAH